MATRKSAAEECCAKCTSDIAALKKEIATLKRELAKKPAGGADPRVDKLIDYLADVSESWKNRLVKSGLK